LLQHLLVLGVLLAVYAIPCCSALIASLSEGLLLLHEPFSEPQLVRVFALELRNEVTEAVDFVTHRLDISFPVRLPHHPAQVFEIDESVVLGAHPLFDLLNALS
jgi:hypothetical protein